MSKKLKLFLGISYLLILFTFLYFIFLQIEISRLNDFSYYKELQLNIDSYIGDNLYINLLIFFVISVAWVALLGFGSPLLITSGILFGKWIGTLIAVVSMSFGALLLYVIASFFFKDLINKIFLKKFFYFFLFRAIGGLGFPFALQNILPVIFNMKKINYFFASFLGFIPGMFVFVTIGSGIDKFVKESDSFSFASLIFSKEIYLPMIMFVILVLVSLVIKKIFFNVRDK